MITKKSLNKLTGHRTISIQEAVHEIAQLDLVLCSDVIKEVSLGQSMSVLRKERTDGVKYQKNDLVAAVRRWFLLMLWCLAGTEEQRGILNYATNPR